MQQIHEKLASCALIKNRRIACQSGKLKNLLVLLGRAALSLAVKILKSFLEQRFSAGAFKFLEFFLCDLLQVVKITEVQGTDEAYYPAACRKVLKIA